MESIKNSIKNLLRNRPALLRAVKKFYKFLKGDLSAEARLNEMYDLLLDYQTKNLQRNHTNPLNSFGRKGFSQTDEDGITIEIIKRLGLKDGTYAEFGVGNGMENNTLILASIGWKGFWVGAEDLAFNYEGAKKFHYIKSWITLDNLVEITRKALSNLKSDKVDVVSLDLDGNDIYFVKKLLESEIYPELFIVEYNAQFPPPAKFQIAYDSTHTWANDNYFGAALQNYDDLFQSHEYMLVCCNSHTGANAFFVKKIYASLFQDVPQNISQIFVSPRYFIHRKYGHFQSPRVIESIIHAEN